MSFVRYQLRTMSDGQEIEQQDGNFLKSALRSGHAWGKYDGLATFCYFCEKCEHSLKSYINVVRGEGVWKGMVNEDGDSSSMHWVMEDEGIIKRLSLYLEQEHGQNTVGNIHERLDFRRLDFSIDHLVRSGSDHCPVRISWDLSK
ncbi:hypothetical protein GH714_011465 [Hevea brasiliensis]|uniref:Endonuclease/exonuclease/phosphatase domain-containing protein n=1 Tax=Hevea brasiliensis TaxID=3981 RepID=A0A6A6M869_HEVBR|nr:hypothetical protein GH714_011465 [Hevea brasiliensis]